ncbi:reticulon-3-like isoform X2 [Ornithodoros turicata]|uniref:reticulon-3-like isoform X2 n=1 Tax=Ornithodoros turicata TaxID=34597 RepID=UPI00313A1D81
MDFNTFTDVKHGDGGEEPQDMHGSFEKSAAQTMDSADDFLSQFTNKPLPAYKESELLSENTTSNVDLLSGFDSLGTSSSAPVDAHITSPSPTFAAPDSSARSDSPPQSLLETTTSEALKEEVTEKVTGTTTVPHLAPNIAPEPKREVLQPSVSMPSDKPNVMDSEATSTTDRKCCPFTSVEELVYWRCAKKSGLAFGGGLVLLLSLTCFSLISVVAHVALGALVVAITFRVYKNVLQAVQKSSDGHPFKQLLEKDITLPKQRVQDVTETVVKHVEHTVVRLRSLFLVEDLVDSLKLAVVLWLLTYVGSWFNGMTLIILGYVALFTLPKVYETYKVEIDKYVAVARTQVCGILGSIKSKIPVGQKPKEQ